MDQFQSYFLQLLEGFRSSLTIFSLTLLFSLPLGLLVAFGRMAKLAPLRVFVKFYISVMRGTPLMLQLMVVFYGPALIFGIRIGDLPFKDYRFTATIIGFVINYAAYFAEIYRGGIESIPAGQHEAGAVLGFSKAQTFIYIVLPQVLRTVLPSVTNEVITLVKDTSLAYVIAYTEMFAIASQISSRETSILPFFIAGGFYYVANYVVQFGMGLLEKRMAYYKR